MNTIDLLLGIDKGKFEKETKKIKVKSLSKKAGKDIFLLLKNLLWMNLRRFQT